MAAHDGVVERLRGAIGRVRARFLPRPAPAAVARAQLQSLLARAPEGALTPARLFGGAPDGLWLWLHTEGYRAVPLLRAILPGMPDEALQRQFTGRAGDDTLRAGFQAYQLFRGLAERHHPAWRRESLLDYGVGWGRILRFWLRDVEPEQLVGIDCTPEMIDFCRRSGRWAEFERVEPLPPTRLADGRFGLVYAYSVFSHLAESAHLRWLEEFHRLLRPGGLLLVTTRPRDFIEMLGDLRRRPEPPSWLPPAFRDTGAWLARYDAGEFCYEPTGGGGVLDASFFGEAAVPRAYVERRWTRWFELLDFIDDRGRCEQAVIVVRKPPAAAG